MASATSHVVRGVRISKPVYTTRFDVLFGFLLPRLGLYRWLVDGGGYEPFEPSVEIDEDRRCERTPFGLLVEPELLAEHVDKLTNFWINIHGFPRSEAGAEVIRWRRFRLSGNSFGGGSCPALPAELVVPDSTMIFSFNVDGTYWEFFPRDPDVLEAVIARWPLSQVVEMTVIEGLYHKP